MLVVLSLARLRAGDDAADAQWFGVKQRVLQTRRVAHVNGNALEQMIALDFTGSKAVLHCVIKLTRLEQGPRIQITRETVITRVLPLTMAKLFKRVSTI